MPRGRARKAGLPPGTVVYVGPQKTDKTHISLINYTETTFEAKEIKSIEDAFEFKDKQGISWLNIDGVQKTEVIEKIGKHFNLHPLTVEDVATLNNVKNG
jgi:magnesium transporter